MTRPTATLLYGLVWPARTKDANRGGTALGLGGGTVAFVGGYLGGHLSLVRKIGTGDPAFGPGDGPDQRQAAGGIDAAADVASPLAGTPIDG